MTSSSATGTAAPTPTSHASCCRRSSADGYVVAIDERDFPANASFLQEMERCIRESRYTVAIVSPRYFESGHTEEEAIISKVLDMGQRRRRLIPFIIQPVAMPAWMFGIVGIDCTAADPLVDPIEQVEGDPRAAVEGPIHRVRRVGALRRSRRCSSASPRSRHHASANRSPRLGGAAASCWPSKIPKARGSPELLHDRCVEPHRVIPKTVIPLPDRAPSPAAHR